MTYDNWKTTNRDDEQMMTSAEEREREEYQTFWKVMACTQHTFPVIGCEACHNKMFYALEALRARGVLVQGGGEPL
jgi:hypothetical protein